MTGGWILADAIVRLVLAGVLVAGVVVAVDMVRAAFRDDRDPIVTVRR